MSAQRSQSPLRSALTRIVHSGIAMEKMEQCDGCRQQFPIRGVELVGTQILCADCAPAEFTAPMHPHLPAHPRLHGSRPGARI